MEKKYIDMLYASLQLERKAVGVKFLRTIDEYEKSESKRLKYKMPYCVSVKLASDGYCIKTNLNTSGCGGATRALGLEKPSKEFCSGEEYLAFEMYKNIDVAKKVADNISLIDEEIYGVDIRPIEKFDEDPDVVIIITSPYNMMRIVQGYTFSHGTKTDFKFAGNQAICSESTAFPYLSDSMNISMLCSGTRYLAGWGEDELAMGISYKKFIDMVAGLYNSINGSERNEKKLIIKEKIDKSKIEDPGIYMDQAYFIRYKE